MFKKILKITLPVLLLIGLFILVDDYMKPEATEGVIEVAIRVEGENPQEIVVTSSEFSTLGDVIDEINESDESVKFKLGGSQTDPYGRFIIGIDDVITEDMTLGPWWLYESSTNRDCLEAGYCSGIDFQSVFDGDVFSFKFE